MTDSTTPATMTSLELVNFINSQREKGEAKLAHHDFLKKVPLVFGKAATIFRGSYKDSVNRDKPCYVFPKYEACLMASSYSDELQTKVFDHMTELEAKASPPSELQTYAAALFEASRLAPTIEEAEQRADHLEATLDSIMEKSGSLSLTDTALVLRVKRLTLTQFLLTNGYIYKHTPQAHWVANLAHINNGNLEHRTTENSTGVYAQVRVTTQGLLHLSKLLEKGN